VAPAYSSILESYETYSVYAERLELLTDTVAETDCPILTLDDETDMETSTESACTVSELFTATEPSRIKRVSIIPHNDLKCLFIL
jgi:hypothetical protein